MDNAELAMPIVCDSTTYELFSGTISAAFVTGRRGEKKGSRHIPKMEDSGQQTVFDKLPGSVNGSGFQGRMGVCGTDP